MTFPEPRLHLVGVVICLLFIALAAGCARHAPEEVADTVPSTAQTDAAGDRTLSVVVSIPPQAYFVERVGGERVAVEVLAGPGDDPHTFEPTARRMAAVTGADVYFRIGVPFEETLAAKLAASAPGLRIVDTRAGITLRPMASGHDHAGHAENTDPHTWLDPLLAARQAATIAAELARMDPAGAEVYSRGLADFTADLHEVDRQLEQALRPVRGGAILVFHPAFGYFAERYGLRQVAVEMEGKEPSPRQLANLVALARQTGTRVVFVQPQFATKSAQAIAREIGGTVVPLDPLARDYLANLRAIAEAIRQGL